MTIPCLITVRTGSTRLYNKCLLPFGKGNVLEHVINRTKEAGFRAIVCTSDQRSDNIIESIATDQKVEFFRGNESDKLRRWRDCCRVFGLDKFHTIDADDPFFSASMVEYSMETLDSGYDLIEPTTYSNDGNASVGYSITRDLLEYACASYVDGSDTEMILPFLMAKKDVRSTILPDSEQCSRIKARLTLDYEEDYWLLKSVLNILGTQSGRAMVDELFERNPDLYLVNWFRNTEWKARQLNKIKTIA
ncbi:MAG: hypothetical protein COB04_01285 [Gammaproteobacteria bacterium]|nr:MAG: hypothetical protein COB04_01285 [Gammaproteobacteria bacterium]